jgi:hypothetical protein
MTINRNNFEAYMLDYLEGNLDPLLTADLMAFLTENPAYEKYLPDYDSTISLSDTQHYAEKHLLKKGFSNLPGVTPGNFDEFCIAACEGFLDNRDMKRLSDFITQYPDKQHDLDLYRMIKLQPDTSVLFNGKSKLKKSIALPIKPRYLYYALGIAASLTLLVMLAVKKPAGTVYTETSPAKKGASENTIQSVPLASSDKAIPVKQVKPALNTKQSHQTIINSSPVAGEQSKSSGRESMFLVTLEPITASTITSIIEPPRITSPLFKTGYGLNQSVSANSETVKLPDSFANSFIGSLINKVDFWKTAKTAVQGFNYLTEAQLSIDETLDENGKLTNLLIGMESYAISGNTIK